MDAWTPSLDDRLIAAAETFGTPCYVFLASEIDHRVRYIRDALNGQFALSFAVKSNPNPAILAHLRGQVEYLDVSAIGEFHAAIAAGWEARQISFTGPAKRQFELEQAIAGGCGELIVESVREAVLADRIAGSMGVVQRVLIRIAPASVPKGFGDQMAGRPSAFGIDWEDADREIPIIAALENLHVAGLHIYSGTQCLRPKAICENLRSFLGIFEAVYRSDLPRPEKLVLGSGFGIPYHDGDVPLDLHAIGRDLAVYLAAFRAQPAFRDTTLVLELGRYLVGEAGYFLTRVVSVKQSRGTRIGICDGGMNNHLAAAGHFGMVMHRNYSMHKLAAKVAEAEEIEKVNLVGPLCTSIDRLGIGVMLPPVGEGDVIAIHNSGAYGLTASPIHFISHAPAKEVFVDARGIRDVSQVPPLPVAAKP